MGNLKLKAAIVGKFGNQANFATALGEHEPVVSRVVNNRHNLSDSEKERWSSKLGFKVSDLFGDLATVSA